MKVAIILASFGVIDEKIRISTIDQLAQEISAEFPNFKVVQAFTSNFIIKKLSERGIKISTVEEQISNLRVENFEKIILMPTHLTVGEEFENKIKIYESEDIRIIPPVFSCIDKKILEVILKNYTIDDEDLILIGHGSPHRHNPVYENFQRLIDEDYKNIHVGVIEENDTPNFDDVMKRLKNRNAKKILLAPLLFNGGSHVEKDIKISWRNRLEGLGYDVKVCVDGLGTFKNFRNLYIERLKECSTLKKS
ncbi:MAG: sirohydrochlorin cobaltochelatase [Selenomonadaceae bacterium]|nr:sirohydrochlorin cobaltochelatase [Selenomonadaceae bacterium]